ncbi:TPA: hypothetical protein NJZ47_004700 [Vibrio parahaemolyticus]|nr:hypothetical protein [Vibrio parahaemolyticus]
MDTKFQHEKSVENIFKDNFEEAAREKLYHYTSASMDGQDRFTGADYLFTNYCRYAIIEFKYREKDLPSEVKKEKRLQLCMALHNDKDIKPLHNKCHFAAWSNDPNDITINTNIYFNEVCNEKFWGKDFPLVTNPTHESRKSENNFIDSFLEGNQGATIKVFNAYMDWLLNLGEESNTNGYLELLITNPVNRRAAGLRFTSVEKMHKWFIDNSPKPDVTPPKKSRNTRKPGSSSGRLG